MSAMLFRNSPQNPFGNSGLTPGGRPEDISAGGGIDDPKLLWDISRTLSDHFSGHQKALPRMMQMIKDLQATLEETRVAYNQVLQDRDQKRQQLAAAEGRLGDVQRVVQRYTVVQEPVVASDGYTYERGTIKQYLDECEATETHAYSQQTKEVLTDTLIPNQSLKKLVELLKTVKPNEVPAATPRNPIPPIRGGSGGGSGNNSSSVNFLEDEDYANDAPAAGGSSNKGADKVFHASDLEAALSTPAANSGKGRGDRNASSNNNNNNDAGDYGHARGGAKRGGNDGEGDSRKEGRERRGGGDNEPPARQQKSEKSSRGGNDRDAPRLHPCLRVYGFCNFKDDCTFAKYPYDACLNNIKGKCRFGPGCKELHVNPSDSKYQNARAQQTQQGSSSGAAAPPAPRSQRDKRDE